MMYGDPVKLTFASGRTVEAQLDETPQEWPVLAMRGRTVFFLQRDHTFNKVKGRRDGTIGDISEPLGTWKRA